MAKNSSSVKVEFKPSVILNLLSALTLYILIMLQWINLNNDKTDSKIILNFFGQIWSTTWIMSFILLLTISNLFIKSRLFKIILGFIIILAIIASCMGLTFVSNSDINTGFVTDLKFIWTKSLLPALIAYITSFIGTILWISNL